AGGGLQRCNGRRSGGAGRRAVATAASVHRARRGAVRDLHAGDAARGPRTAPTEPAAVGGRRARRSGRESLPLHRLHQDHRRRARMPDVTYLRPRDVAHAVRLCEGTPDARPLGGGTDLMVMLHAGTVRPRALVDLWSLAELKGIRRVDGGVEIGAAEP